MAFIENNPERAAELVRQLNPVRAELGDKNDIVLEDPIVGDCVPKMHAWLDRLQEEGRRPGPALAFFDQFGYSEVPMALIARILGYPSCEVFVYIEFKNINRFISDPNKEQGFTIAFGGDEWKQCVPFSTRAERLHKLRELYVAALRGRGSSKYVQHFTMFDKDTSPLYWLFFCTNHLRGLEEMKKAMWSVDAKGEFRFSDADTDEQGTLLDGYSQEWLAEELASRLRGRELGLPEINEWVLTETPCYKFKTALKTLEQGKKVLVIGRPSGKNVGTFSDDAIRIRFDDSLF